MIYTCTLNPSLDYYMEFENNIKINKTNRSNLEYYMAGGKGINISIILSNLGIHSKAFSFIGGFTKDFYISLIEHHSHLEPSFVTVDGHTRINVKIKDSTNTELNATGPFVNEVARTNMFKRIKRLTTEDIIVLSGNTPKDLNVYLKDIVNYLSEENIPFVLDVDETMEKELIEFKPLLMKFTLDELCNYFGVEVNEENIVDYAIKLKNSGAKNVIITLDEYHLLINDKGVYKAKIIKEYNLDSTLAGDTVIAGFVFNLQRGFDTIESFRYGCACGIGASFNQGLEGKQKVEALYDKIKLEVVKEF